MASGTGQSDESWSVQTLALRVRCVGTRSPKATYTVPVVPPPPEGVSGLTGNLSAWEPVTTLAGW